MRFFQPIGIILLSIFLIVGCSSKPSESDAKQAFEQEIQENSNGLIKLISFKKTNGIEKQRSKLEGGGAFYTMEWIATIESTCDCYWWLWDFRIQTDPDSGMRGVTYHHKGERVDVIGATDFEKTENGWRSIEMHRKF